MESGKDSDDWADNALAIMNSFTKRPHGVVPYPSDPDHFWVRKLAALCERCAKAEDLLYAGSNDTGHACADKNQPTK
jgi:hypothetical protein